MREISAVLCHISMCVMSLVTTVRAVNLKNARALFNYVLTKLSYCAASVDLGLLACSFHAASLSFSSLINHLAFPVHFEVR